MQKTNRRIAMLAVAILGVLNVEAQKIVDQNVFKDITTLAKVRSTRFLRPSPAGKLRKEGKPVAFYIGDSTMRTNSNGEGWNGQWGFGLFAQEWFDDNELVVENHALGGTTSVTFYDNEWPTVKKGIREGDFVVIDFGHNDKDVDLFGQYMGKYIDEVRALGATPVLCSRTPRCGGDGKLSFDTKYRPKGMEVAKEKGVAYIDLEGVAYPMYKAFGDWKTTQFYQDGKLHTSLLGAWHNAYCHALAIAADADNPLRPFLKDTTLATMDIEREAGKPYTFVAGGSDTSARGTYRSGRWMLLYNTLERGDSVLLTFGPNELKSITSSGELGCLQSTDDTQQEIRVMTSTNRNETVYSYGWYIRYFVNDVKEKGAVPVIVNEEGVTPDKVMEWNETLSKRYGVELRVVSGATNIVENRQEAAKNAGTAYTIAGQPVGPDYQGLVIINGKKSVRK